LDVFLDRVAPEHLLAQVGMFSERLDISEATDRISECSSVLFTEDFALGLEGLGQRLGLPLEVHRARVTKSRTMLTDRQMDQLEQRLEPEYELLRRLREGGIARMGLT
jgi:hypothetical protein